MSPQRVSATGSILFAASCFAASSAVAANYVRDYLVNDIALPATNAEASNDAIDLDGDGHAENQLGAVFAAIGSTMGMDFHGTTADAVASGSIVHVVRLKSTDVAFSSDASAETDWYVGNPLSAPPAFDGLDSPTTDNSIAPGIFHAALSGGAFTSPPPATAPTPAFLPLQLLFGPGPRFNLPLQGARLAFTTSPGGDIQGQINGAVAEQDIANGFIPAFANWLESIVQADPTSDSATTLLSLFDHGCGTDDGLADDGHIEACEVANSSFMQTLLAPDVQLDGTGHYVLPITTPNALSFGFRFAAIKRDRVFASGFDLIP